MFHFGLFSSFVPYLVIAAIYFCGLASYSVDIVNKHITKDQSKTSFCEANQLSVAANYAVIEFQDNLSIEKSNLSKAEQTFSIVDEVYWHITDPWIEDNGHGFSLFSRPPPYLS